MLSWKLLVSAACLACSHNTHDPKCIGWSYGNLVAHMFGYTDKTSRQVHHMLNQSMLAHKIAMAACTEAACCTDCNGLSVRDKFTPACWSRQTLVQLSVCVWPVVMHESAWHAGVGNMPDLPQQGWLPWLKSQRKKGLQVHQHLQNASPDSEHAVLVYAAYSS